MANPWEQSWQTEDGPWSQDWSGVQAAPAYQYMPSPYEAQIDISTPRADSPTTQFLKGAAITLRRGGRGLKGLVSELSASDIAELDAMKRYEEEAGMPAKIGAIGAELPMYAAGATLGPATMLGRAASAAGTAAALSPEDRMQQAGQAALGSYVGESALRGLGKMLRGPVAQPGVSEAVAEGVRPTFMQALGGPFKTFEEKMESVPLIGPSISGAQRRSMETFNTATLQKIVDDLNRGVGETSTAMSVPGERLGVQQQIVDIGDIKPGAEGFRQVKGAIKDAYGRLVQQTSGELTPEFEEGLAGIRDLSSTLRESYGKQIDQILKNVVESRFKPGVRVDGQTIKEIDSELTNLAENYSRSSTADERRVGDAIREAQRQLHLMLEQQNPGAADALRNADSAYWKLKRVEQASTSSVANELFTPAQLMQSLRGRNRAQFAEGQMPMQEWARINQEIMGNRYPDSGTAGRLGLNELFTAGVSGLPVAAATYFGGKGLYSPAVQDFLVQRALQQPGPARRAMVRGLSSLYEPASALGASIGTGY
jgi:hypothetical protein